MFGGLKYSPYICLIKLNNMKKILVLGILLVNSISFGQVPTFFKDTERTFSIKASNNNWFRLKSLNDGKENYVFRMETKPENYIPFMKETKALLTYYGLDEYDAQVNESFNDYVYDKIEYYTDLTDNDIQKIVMDYLTESSKITKGFNITNGNLVVIRDKTAFFLLISIKQNKVKKIIKKKK